MNFIHDQAHNEMKHIVKKRKYIMMTFEVFTKELGSKTKLLTTRCSRCAAQYKMYTKKITPQKVGAHCVEVHFMSCKGSIEILKMIWCSGFGPIFIVFSSFYLNLTYNAILKAGCNFRAIFILLYMLIPSNQPVCI